MLLGAVGGPKWGSDKPAEQRPETALLAIRKDLGLYANLRPAALRPPMAGACPLKKETAEKGIDLMMVRELTGGIYFGKRDRYQTEDRGRRPPTWMAYSEQEIERIGRRAFELARLRRNKVSSVDKANVLETSRLWRKVMHRLAEEYPTCPMRTCWWTTAPCSSSGTPASSTWWSPRTCSGTSSPDEASMVTGSIGLLPSASIGDAAPGLYEPIHGSARHRRPGQGQPHRHHPVQAMMFRYPSTWPRRPRPSKTPWTRCWLRAGAPPTSPSPASSPSGPGRWAGASGKSSDSENTQTRDPQVRSGRGGPRVLCPLEEREWEQGRGEFGEKHRMEGALPLTCTVPCQIVQNFRKITGNHLQSCKSAHIICHA